MRWPHADPDVLGVCLKGGDSADEVGMRDLDTFGGACGARGVHNRAQVLWGWQHRTLQLLASLGLHRTQLADNDSHATTTATGTDTPSCSAVRTTAVSIRSAREPKHIVPDAANLHGPHVRRRPMHDRGFLPCCGTTSVSIRSARGPKHIVPDVVTLRIAWSSCTSLTQLCIDMERATADQELSIDI